MTEKYFHFLSDCQIPSQHVNTLIAPLQTLFIYSQSSSQSDDEGEEINSTDSDHSLLSQEGEDHDSPFMSINKDVCFFCSQAFVSKHFVWCEEDCPMKAHLICLASWFLSQELKDAEKQSSTIHLQNTSSQTQTTSIGNLSKPQQQLLPTVGYCPYCGCYLKWRNLIESKRKRENNEEESTEKNKNNKRKRRKNQNEVLK